MVSVSCLASKHFLFMQYSAKVVELYILLSLCLAHNDELSSVVRIYESLPRLRCPAQAVEAREAVLPVLHQLFNG